MNKGKNKLGNQYEQKRASDLYRTAQPPTLASFRTWGNSVGASRIRLAQILPEDPYKFMKFLINKRVNGSKVGNQLGDLTGAGGVNKWVIFVNN